MISFILSTPCCLGFKKFQSQIPNGDRVANPCTENEWQGVGHEHSNGGGERNPFGQDFKKSGMVSEHHM